MTLDELNSLLDPQVLALIDAHAGDDPATFAMQFHGRSDLPVRAMAEQIACRKKAAAKLPSLAHFPMLYTRLGLEQASGERAGEWKASLMHGRRAIDLTGGLGIDTLFLARRFDEVVSCERDEALARLAEANRRVMGINNVEMRIGDSAELLAGYPDDSFDWVLVDPARRDHGGRSAGLSVSSPDVVRLHDLMLRKAPRVCIKASPALEISGLDAQLPTLSEVIAVSVDGECKEVLLLLDRRHDAGRMPGVRAVCLGNEAFEIASSGDAERQVAEKPGSWLYEPDAAIIKARLTGELARQMQLSFLNRTVDYLTSDRLIEPFPGRSFRIEECRPFRQKSFRKELAELGITNAAIQRRDFPLSVEELRKRYKIGESSEHFLFFTKGASGGFVWLSCRKP
ncbi:class I SAM-dependent methyltransferase [Chlorobaculum sp. MV4-Y]|nr:class I SAM-dependent methyltransferase [Chlorobaculum sp. MV4-Y]UWX58799.1 class I SAM-dependent methyltransferase [Chlorobaculum sp. MV4-Y]